MKKIGIDARLYSQTGIGTYLQNFLFYLDKSNPENFFYYIYLRKEDFYKVKFNSKNLIKILADYPWHSLSEQLGFLRRLNHDKLDLMHFTYFSYPIFYHRKFIATVHDVTPLLFKTGKASTKNQLIYNIKHLFFRIILLCQIKKAINIITPTYTVKEQLEKIYGEKISNKIIPIYEGISYKIIKTFENKDLDKKFKEFFIYVGNFYPHKNVEKLIYAFSKIETSNKLILLGPNDYFKRHLFSLINKLKQEKRILFFNNPQISDLVYFYKNGEALIHPSLSEGFGLPLIEAAYFNCPIIASNIKVFKELLGNNYLSFNPNDVNDIAEKIKTFIEKKPKFDYGNILKQYSFEEMTNKTVKIYKSVLYEKK
jgi:glycosyltransferase involved in cell wall biosynthesis